VRVPFVAYADPVYLVMDPGQTRRVSVTIEDRSLTGLDYLCQVGKASSPDPGDWLEWVLLWLDANSLELGPGETETVNLEVVIPQNATAGTMGVPVLVMVEGHPEYTRQLDLTVRVQGVPVAPPGGDGDGTWLPVDPWLLLMLSIVIVGIGLVGFLGFTEVGTLALFWGLLLPLFTRLRRKEVLNQFTRGEIYGFIKANPGVHLTAIKENLGLANGVLAYHLKVLTREEFIVVRREGGFKRFYPRDMRVPRKRVHFTRLQLDIVEKLHLHPGLTQASLARMLGESKQVINYNVSVLMAADVVRVEREGGKTLCYVKDGAAIRPQMAELVDEDEEETVDATHAIPAQMKL
jgi:predicted transcriptional regulator